MESNLLTSTLHSKKMVEKLEVVFDPSLLLPPSHLLMDDMEPASIEITEKMSDVIISFSERDYLPTLLSEWMSEKMPYELSISWFKNIENKKSKFLVIPTSKLPPEVIKFASRHLIEALKKHTDLSGPVLEFVSDEISLALHKKIPILATQTSSWKIVQILENIGAKVQKEIVQDGETKEVFLNKDTKKKNWRTAVAKSTGAAFIWCIGGPSSSMSNQGVKGISVVIEDP
jgi:hypothetical protein